MKNFDLEKRRYVLSAIASLIIVVYIIRLFSLQIASDDYRKSADSNAFLKKIEFPSRGTITDRNGKLLVYNQPAYDIMVVMNEEAGRLDTMDFCNALGITKEFFKKRMAEIKDRSKTLATHDSPNSCSWVNCQTRSSAHSKRRSSASLVLHPASQHPAI